MSPSQSGILRPRSSIGGKQTISRLSEARLRMALPVIWNTSKLSWDSVITSFHYNGFNTHYI